MRMWIEVAPAARTMLTILVEVVPRTMESSTSTTRRPSIIRRLALCLSLTPMWRIESLGWNEGAADIVVADDAEFEGNSRALRKADCGGHAGIGHRHDDIGIDRRFAASSRRCACARHRPSGHSRRSRVGRNRHIRKCRRGACLAGKGFTLCTPSLSMITISPCSMSRTKRAPMMSSAQVSDARIQAPSRSPSTSGRMPSGSRAADQLLVGEGDERIGAFELAQGVDEAVGRSVCGCGRSDAG